MSGAPRKVRFLVYRDGLGSIFEPVYLAPAARLRASGFDVRILVTSQAGEWVKPSLARRWRALGERIEARLPGGLVRIPAPPSRWRAWRLEKWITGRFLAAQIGRGEEAVIHAGSAFAANLALHAAERRPELKVVYHSWGPEAAEYEFGMRARGGGMPESRLREECRFRDRLQEEAFRRADASICISRPMRREAVDRFGADPRRLHVVPCFVDAGRHREAASGRCATRRSLGIDDRFVVLYAGSTLPWQLPPGAFEAFRAVRERRRDAFLLALTPHPGHMARLMRENGIGEGECRVLAPAMDEVPGLMAAGDAGLLGRGLLEVENPVNAVASPLKFGEYLASGNPVIMGEGVGDFSSLARERGVGAVVPHGATPAVLRAEIGRLLDSQKEDPAALRERCRQTAARELDIDLHVPRIAALYRDLLSHPPAGAAEPEGKEKDPAGAASGG